MTEFVSVIGQDSHRFVGEGDPKPLILGGYRLPGAKGLAGNSDADLLLHALTNAISALTGRPILGAAADVLCLDQGITDSKAYLDLALADLVDQGKWEINFISFSLQGKQPKVLEHIPKIRQSVARLTGLEPERVMLTATTGEGLTAFGRGEGLEALCILSAKTCD